MFIKIKIYRILRSDFGVLETGVSSWSLEFSKRIQTSSDVSYVISIE